MTQDIFTPQELLARSIRARKLLTWLIVLAIVMFFAGLTSAYVVSMSSTEYWTHFAIPQPFYISTVAILISSLTLHLALGAARKGNAKAIAPFLGVTLVLGLAFSWFQVQGWKELADRKFNFVSQVLLAQGEYGTDYTITRNGTTLLKEDGNYFMPEDAERKKPLNAEMEDYGNAASSYFHVLTRAHLGHLLFGLLGLGVMIVMAVRGRYTQEDHVGLWAGTIYWHFLGGLWIYLLLFLVFVH